MFSACSMLCFVFLEPSSDTIYLEKKVYEWLNYHFILTYGFSLHINIKGDFLLIKCLKLTMIRNKKLLL